MKTIKIDVLIKNFFNMKIFICSIILTTIFVYFFSINITKTNKINITIIFNLNKDNLFKLEEKYSGSKLALSSIEQEVSLKLKEQLYLTTLDMENSLKKIFNKDFKKSNIKIVNSGSVINNSLDIVVYNTFKGKNAEPYVTSDLTKARDKIYLFLKKKYPKYEFYIFLKNYNFVNQDYKLISIFVFLLTTINLLLLSINFRKKLLSN